MTPSESEDRSRPAGSTARSVPAWVVFATVLLIEYLLISYVFDVRDLLVPTGLDERLSDVGSALPLIFVVIAATLITGGAATQKALLILTPFRESMAMRFLFAGLHGAAFLLTLAVGHQLLAAGLGAETRARVQLALFSVLPVLSVGLGVLALWERSTVSSALREIRSALLLGVGVGVVAWGMGLAAQVIWQPLAWLTLELVHALLTVISPDPVASVADSLVGTSRFYVHVAPVCSGVEGIGLMIAFVATFFYLERGQLRWPRALLLLPIAIVGTWLLNAVRLTALIVIGTWVSADVALGGFHSKAGWVFFTAMALGTILVVRRSPYFYRVSEAERPQGGTAEASQLVDEDHPSTVPDTRRGASEFGADAAYLVPLLAVVAVSLVTGLLTADFDYFYPLRVIVAVVCLVMYRKHYPALRFDAPWLFVGAGIIVAVVWILGFHEAQPGGDSDIPITLSKMPSLWAGTWLICRLVGGVLTVPFVEELAFRGYLMRRLSTPAFESLRYSQSSWIGLAVSSLVFGALHSQWLLGVFAGVTFGLVAMARNRLADAILAHAIANLGVAMYALLTGTWSLLG